MKGNKEKKEKKEHDPQNRGTGLGLRGDALATSQRRIRGVVERPAVVGDEDQDVPHVFLLQSCDHLGNPHVHFSV